MNYYTSYDSEELTAPVFKHIENIEHLEEDFLNMPEEYRQENDDILGEIESFLVLLEAFKPETVLTVAYNDNINTFTWEIVQHD